MYFLQQLHEHEIKEAFFVFSLNVGGEALISMWITKGEAIIWDLALIRDIWYPFSAMSRVYLLFLANLLIAL